MAQSYKFEEIYLAEEAHESDSDEISYDECCNSKFIKNVSVRDNILSSRLEDYDANPILTNHN
jgi:hypothetical protein